MKKPELIVAKFIFDKKKKFRSFIGSVKIGNGNNIKWTVLIYILNHYLKSLTKIFKGV